MRPGEERRQRGQGTTEYVGGLAVVALVVLALAVGVGSGGVAATVTAALSRNACTVLAACANQPGPATAATSQPAPDEPAAEPAPVVEPGPVYYTARQPTPMTLVSLAAFEPEDLGGCGYQILGGALAATCAPPEGPGSGAGGLGECGGLGSDPGGGTERTTCLPPSDLGPGEDCGLAQSVAGSCIPPELPSPSACTGLAAGTSASSYCPDDADNANPCAPTSSPGADASCAPQETPTGEYCTPFGPGGGFGGTVGMCIDDRPPGPHIDAADPGTSFDRIRHWFPTEYVRQGSNHRPGEDAVLQGLPLSCTLACGEMLSGGEASERDLVASLGPQSGGYEMAAELNRRAGQEEWEAIDFLRGIQTRRLWDYRFHRFRQGPSGAVIMNPPPTPIDHMVVIEPLEGDRFLVRDPGYGSYEVDAGWIQRWVRQGIFRVDPPRPFPPGLAP